MTIHITPEPDYSYVSFESNIPLTSYLGVIQRVLDTFQPGKFILTIFANRVFFCPVIWSPVKFKIAIFFMLGFFTIYYIHRSPV